MSAVVDFTGLSLFIIWIDNSMWIYVLGLYYFYNFLLSVVTQNYLVEVNNEHVIRGNSAVIKCNIPSFVADFISVLSWNDNTGNEYIIHHDYTPGIFGQEVLNLFKHLTNKLKIISLKHTFEGQSPLSPPLNRHCWGWHIGDKIPL